METIETDFTAVGAGRAMLVPKGSAFSWEVAGTFEGTVVLETSKNGGASWETLESLTTTGSGAKVSNASTGCSALFRFRCDAFVSGTVETEISSVARRIQTFSGPQGGDVVVITEDGLNVEGDLEADEVSTPLVSADVLNSDELSELTADAGVKAGSQIWSNRGSAAGLSALSFGGTKVEGLHVQVIEETVSLVGAAAKFVALTTPIPAGAVILSAQLNVEALVVAGGTTVKVALGLNAGDVDKYGKTATLVKNQKANVIPDHAVLAAPEQIDVCGVVTDGSALGDSNFTAGSVRVRIVYLELASLTNAA